MEGDAAGGTGCAGEGSTEKLDSQNPEQAVGAWKQTHSLTWRKY